MFLDYFFIITTVIGIVLTIYYGKKSLELEKSKKKLEFSDFLSCANDLGAKIKQKKGFRPDLVFTPGLRGGTFAHLLLKEFDYDLPVFVGVSSWKSDKGSKNHINGFFLIETSKWFMHVPESTLDWKDKKMLIVDDFAMSGDFLAKAKDFFISHGFREENIKTLCIVTTKVAIKNHKSPDYYWMETLDDNFYFPWGKAR
ncbi:MAG: hypothetical protein IH588_05920 [Anaerolineales bacterium]|nr:hypothetical protein [Anaerolineales bacterium]